MSWLKDFVVSKPKDAGYAQRVLDRYRLGMRARGAIRGVRIITSDDSCPACRATADKTFLPDDAPIIPIAGCTHPEGCRCAYTPVMTYEGQD